MSDHKYRIYITKNPNDTKKLSIADLIDTGVQTVERELKLGDVVELEADDHVVHGVVIKIEDEAKPKMTILREVGRINKVVKIV